MLAFKDVSKHYRQGSKQLQILRSLSFDLRRGEKCAILGRSGSGKTTFLSLAAGFDRADSGEIFLGDSALHQMSEEQLAKLRKTHLGVIFQNYQLIPHLTALENLRLPLDLLQDAQAHSKAMALMDRLQILERASHYPHQLSGGEAQRVAIGRALIHRPLLVLADEPTGNLDEQTGAIVIQLLWELLEANQQSFILVTHDQELAQRCDRILELQGGQFS